LRLAGLQASLPLPKHPQFFLLISIEAVKIDAALDLSWVSQRTRTSLFADGSAQQKAAIPPAPVVRGPSVKTRRPSVKTRRHSTKVWVLFPGIQRHSRHSWIATLILAAPTPTGSCPRRRGRAVTASKTFEAYTSRRGQCGPRFYILRLWILYWYGAKVCHQWWVTRS
jgi:hypothetical protein